jgi:hypothetical protein
MSSLKVASINHPSAPSGGLSISTSGLVSGGGLDLIVSQSFTAASTVSVDECFTSDYDNYVVMLKATTSTSAEVRMCTRASGVDETGSVYEKNGVYVANSTTVTGAQANAAAFFGLSVGAAYYRRAIRIELFDPFAAEYTHVLATAGNVETTSNAYQSLSGAVTNTTSYDGISFFPDTGTITGTLRVYGYRN